MHHRCFDGIVLVRRVIYYLCGMGQQCTELPFVPFIPLSYSRIAFCWARMTFCGVMVETANSPRLHSSHIHIICIHSVLTPWYVWMGGCTLTLLRLCRWGWIFCCLLGYGYGFWARVMLLSHGGWLVDWLTRLGISTEFHEIPVYFFQFLTLPSQNFILFRFNPIRISFPPPFYSCRILFPP